MKKECFSCQKNAPYTLINSLLLHKRIYETTGQVFWFFKESENDKVKITDDASFKIIIEQIKNNEGANWCHIAEFGQSTNDNVFGDIGNKKLKAVKRKRNTKTT